MDLKVNNSFIFAIVERILIKLVKKKLGIDVDICVSELEVNYKGENARVTISGFADVNKNDISKLLKKFNV